MNSGYKPLILIVDDNATIRNLVATILGEQDMEIVALADGDEALAFVETRRPDLMLLDLSMPRVDGLEVLKRIRAHPALHDLLILMLTAVASTPRYQEIYAHKPDGFIEKPFRMNDLIQQVKQTMARRRETGPL